MKKKRSHNLMIGGLLCLSLSVSACQNHATDVSPSISGEAGILAPESTPETTSESVSVSSSTTADITETAFPAETGPFTTEAETFAETSPEATPESSPKMTTEISTEGTTEASTEAPTEAPTEVPTEAPTTAPSSEPGSEYLSVPAVSYVLSAEDDLLSELGYPVPAEPGLKTAIAFDAIYSLPVKQPGHEDTPAYLIDFYGPHGYLIVDDAFRLYAVQTEGDYAALAAYTDLCYAMTDGLIYTDGTMRMNADRAITLHPTPTNRRYSAQKYDHEGGIINTSSYISSRYKGGYEPDRFALIDFSRLYRQHDLSVFFTDDGYGESGEGNCTPSAVYTCLDILGRSLLKDTALASALDETTTIDVVNDPNYPKYADNPDYIFKPYIDLPLVYAKIREHLIRNYDYTEGTAPWVNETLFNLILEEYDCDLKAVNHYAWTYQETLIPAIDAGRPVQMSIANTKDYGDHSISVLGYEYWTQISPVCRLNHIESLFFLTVADNWDTQAVCMDTNIQAIVANIITFEQKE